MKLVIKDSEKSKWLLVKSIGAGLLIFTIIHHIQIYAKRSETGAPSIAAIKPQPQLPIHIVVHLAQPERDPVDKLFEEWDRQDRALRFGH